MKKSLLAVIIIFTIQNVAYAEENLITRKVFMDISVAFTYQRGKVSKMAEICNKGELKASFTPSNTAGLLINYMSEEEVQIIMKEYFNGMKKMKDWKCNKNELKRTATAFMETFSNYIKIGRLFQKPY